MSALIPELTWVKEIRPIRSIVPQELVIKTYPFGMIERIERIFVHFSSAKLILSQMNLYR